MDFWEVLKKRKSVRDFDMEKTVSNELIAKIIDAGKSAPSAGAVYPVEFIAITDREIRESLAAAAFGQNFIILAPVIIIVIADLKRATSYYSTRGRELYAIQDAAAAVENMLLAITALGLGSCWIGAFSEEEVSKILGLEAYQRPLTILPVGWLK
jgi:nitroreductase